MEPAATTTTTTSKDMPESLALSDILAVPEPPSSLVINPHDIQLQPFNCTQTSQDQEFASRYPASAPDSTILPSSSALRNEVEREFELQDSPRQQEQDEQEQEQQQQQAVVAVPAPAPQHHAPPQPTPQLLVLPLHHDRTPTPPTTSPEPSPLHHNSHDTYIPLDPTKPNPAFHTTPPNTAEARRHYSLKKVEHLNSKANRRGPMDEMRQLVRIMVKLMPKSMPYLKVDEAGGGNRVTEDDIKAYIVSVLGEAPQPRWGLPDGWGAYLSELFTWTCGRPVGREEAMRCARRLPGRSWEAVDEELARLGLCPANWPLPLTLKGVKEANAGAHMSAPAPAAPLALPGPASITGVRTLESRANGAEEHVAAPKKKKARMSVQEQVLPLVNMATETECWYLALQFLTTAREKAGTTAASRTMELNAYQSGVRNIMDAMPRGPGASLQLNTVAMHAGTRHQLLGNFPPSEGAEQVFHPHQLAIPSSLETIYLPSNQAIVPVPVANLTQLGMQSAAGIPGLPNLPPLQPLLTQVRGGHISTSEAASEPSTSDANPAKPLRPMARSVQQLGMQGPAYQLVSSGTEPAGSKGHLDSQKFLGGNVFAPYSGGASKPMSSEHQSSAQEATAAWFSRTMGGEVGDAGTSGAADKQVENPRDRLRGMVAHIATTALNHQATQSAAVMEALGLPRPGSGQQQRQGGLGLGAQGTDQQGEAVRASAAMPASAV